MAVGCRHSYFYSKHVCHTGICNRFHRAMGYFGISLCRTPSCGLIFFNFTQVFPGLFVLGAGASSSTDGHMEPLLQEDHKPIGTPRVLDLSRAPEIISRRNSALIAKVLVALGIVTFFVCLLAAIGKISITQLRGDSIIGCERWRILNKEV